MNNPLNIQVSSLKSQRKNWKSAKNTLLGLGRRKDRPFPFLGIVVDCKFLYHFIIFVLKDCLMKCTYAFSFPFTTSILPYQVSKGLMFLYFNCLVVCSIFNFQLHGQCSQHTPTPHVMKRSCNLLVSFSLALSPQHYATHECSAYFCYVTFRS